MLETDSALARVFNQIANKWITGGGTEKEVCNHWKSLNFNEGSASLPLISIFKDLEVARECHFRVYGMQI